MDDRSTAIAMIDSYLQLCEDREMEAARAYWAIGDLCIFQPGGGVSRSFSELLEWAKGNYRWVRKQREQYAVELAPDKTVVSNWGTLYGVAVDGQSFKDVRYIDVFIIRDNLITEQHIWNDLALRLTAQDNL